MLSSDDYEINGLGNVPEHIKAFQKQIDKKIEDEKLSDVLNIHININSSSLEECLVMDEMGNMTVTELLDFNDLFNDFSGMYDGTEEAIAHFTSEDFRIFTKIKEIIGQLPATYLLDGKVCRMDPQISFSNYSTEDGTIKYICSVRIGQDIWNDGLSNIEIETP